LDSIPIDLVRFPYPELEPPLKINNINVLRLPDLAAMKLNAISRRGRKRDFFDIYFLLERYSLEDLISFFIRRFPKSNLIHIFKSLIYFEDAEKDPKPQRLKTVSWNQVKEKIGKVALEIDFSKYQ